MIAADYDKGTVPLKLGIFLFQTNWLKMAQGDFLLFFWAKYFPKIDNWGLIFKGPHHEGLSLQFVILLEAPLVVVVGGRRCPW